jgi:hypothetical protein
VPISKSVTVGIGSKPEAVVSRILFLLVSFAFSSLTHAGGNWAEAKIDQMSFNKNGDLVVEFTWLHENGFTSGSDYRRVSFEYHNWPPATHRWIYRLLPWTRSDEEAYSQARFAACENYILESYKKNLHINLGQMGTVPFQDSLRTEKAGVVAFAEVYERPGEKACMLYAAPI